MNHSPEGSHSSKLTSTSHTHWCDYIVSSSTRERSSTTDDPKDPTTRSKTSESVVHEDGALSPPLWAVSSWMVARFTACRLSMNREIRIAVRLGIRSRQSAERGGRGNVRCSRFGERYYIAVAPDIWCCDLNAQPRREDELVWIEGRRPGHGSLTEATVNERCSEFRMSRHLVSSRCRIGNAARGRSTHRGYSHEVDSPCAFCTTHECGKRS